MAKGFSLYMVKAIMSRRGEEVIDLAKTNLGAERIDHEDHHDSRLAPRVAFTVGFDGATARFHRADEATSDGAGRLYCPSRIADCAGASRPHCCTCCNPRNCSGRGC